MSVSEKLSYNSTRALYKSMKTVSKLEFNFGEGKLLDAMSHESLEAVRTEYKRLTEKFPLGKTFAEAQEAHRNIEEGLKKYAARFYSYSPERMEYLVV